MPMRWRWAMGSNCGREFCVTSRLAHCNRVTLPLMKTTTATIPPPRRAILPRRSFLTTTSLIATRGCHNRCGFCYLATDGLRMPYRMRDPEQVADEFLADGQPYAVFIDNNLGSQAGLPAHAVQRSAAAQQNLERGRHHRRHR